MTNLLPCDGHADLLVHWLDEAVASHLLDVLHERLEWREETLRIFGRSVPVPRRVAWYGDHGVAYRYSGIDHQARGWPADLLMLRDKITKDTGFKSNSVLCNLYRHGRNSMGWHRDAEAVLGLEPCIASVSLGAARPFEFQHCETGERVTLVLPHGSLLMMTGATQHRWRHRLPKIPRLEQTRINLTFRQVYPL